MTGSFLEAADAGMSPPNTVIKMLIPISIRAGMNGTEALISTPSVICMEFITMLAGMHNSIAAIIPMIPDNAPIINVSALNTCAIFPLDAPNARRIPISYVLSSTEICVIIPIMIHDTTKDTATNAISIPETVSMIEAICFVSSSM